MTSDKYEEEFPLRRELFLPNIRGWLNRSKQEQNESEQELNSSEKEFSVGIQ